MIFPVVSAHISLCRPCIVRRGEEFHLDPVAEATAEEVAESGHNFEKDMRLKHNARSTHSTQGTEDLTLILLQL